MISRCYLEITNVCNLDCLFCPKTERKGRTMSVEEFDLLTDRLAGRIKFLYFHLMGEPLMHRHLPEKSSDPTRWVQMMNNIKSSAEEIVLKEVVYK